MKLQKLTLKNYKSHKEFTADFRGENVIVKGNKGSGKTSLRDAFYWLLTATMVDDPTPVDENGKIIDHLTIGVEAEFDDGTILSLEDSQKWVKNVLKGNHSTNYFINGTPTTEKDYQAWLDKHVGTLEQRKILLDPTWFAHGDGLRVTGKTSKTAKQRRREIVISVAGAENIESEIAENEEKAKQAKFAISRLKKELDDANAGIESLHEAKIDVGHLDELSINQLILELENEKTSTTKSLEALQSGNDTHNALSRAVSDAKTNFSQAKAKYMQEYNQRLEEANKPYNEYIATKQNLEQRLQQAQFAHNQQENNKRTLISDIDRLESKRQELLVAYENETNSVYIPNSTMCPTCGQSLPSDRLVEAEARFNKHKSDELESILKRGNEIKTTLEAKRKELSLLNKDFGIDELEDALFELQEPVQENVPTYEETEQYRTLSQAIQDAQYALENNSDDNAKEIYVRKIDDINVRLSEQRELLGLFDKNKHLDEQIELKGEQLQGIATRLDEQKDILDSCNEFTREILTKLETNIQEKFGGIRFKMFNYTLDGEQKDDCVTYAKTDKGFIPWESLSGGQKRSATINLANAFTKAWGIELPLWIDDTQIYSDDELNATMQLIRITEVPNARLEVS